MSSSTTQDLRIAMWSGPRNISTAMMRSFGNRPDTTVVDEPFYACYLLRTGLDHPGREEILRSQPTEWADVVAALQGPLPPGKTIWYQKHMAHHMLPGQDVAWLFDPRFRHVFLIRQPRQMLRSLNQVLGNVSLDQTGLPQQVRLFELLTQRTGVRPAVLDARDILTAPGDGLRRLCEHLEIPFLAEMLAWPPGPRTSDGVWGPHWYSRLYETTGFATDVVRDEPLPPHCSPLLADCEALYDQLAQARL